MQDQLLAVVWRFLTVEDLIRLSQTNKTFHQLIKNPNTWNFLLQRDFNIKSTQKDPRRKYFGMLLKQLADSSNRYAAILYNTTPDPDDEIFTREQLEGDAYLFKNYATSALGLSETNKYGILCGNKIGSAFWQSLPDNIEMLSEYVNPDANLVDSLIYNINFCRNRL